MVKGFTWRQIRDSIVSLLYAMEAGKGASASTPVDKHRFAELEFAVGSNADIGLHGSTLESSIVVTGHQVDQLLAAAMVWQATPKVWNVR